MVIDAWLYDQITAGRFKKTGYSPTERGEQGIKLSLMMGANS